MQYIQVSQGELSEDGNLAQSKRVKAHLILISILYEHTDIHVVDIYMYICILYIIVSYCLLNMNKSHGSFAKNLTYTLSCRKPTIFECLEIMIEIIHTYWLARMKIEITHFISQCLSTLCTLYMYMYGCMHKCLYVCTYVHTYTYMYLYVCIQLYLPA